MSKKAIFIFTFIFIILFPSFSQPEIFDEQPKNGTYIYGKDDDIFSIKVISNTTIEGYLYVRVKDPTSIWKEINMNCYKEETWICNATVPGLEALLAEGKYLLYYFVVTSSEGASFYGNQYSPLEVLVDRTPPSISLAMEYKDLTYISEKKRLIFTITDNLSGVNIENVFFSYGNISWNSSWIKPIYDNQTKIYIATWDTSILPNNSSWIIYVNASDLVGNYQVKNLGLFYIDNEEPEIIEHKPKSYDGLWGLVEIYARGKDKYSGVKKMKISIIDFQDYIYCINNECSYTLNTLRFSDGNYTLNLTIYDDAENSYTILVPIRIDNTYPILKLEYPSEYLKGIVNFTLRIGNINRLANSTLEISNSSWKKEYSLNCDNFICNFSIDTTLYQDGSYLITIRVVNDIGYISNYSKQFIFDNTLPKIIPSEPIYENSTLKLSFGLLDEIGVNANLSKIDFEEEILLPTCRILTEGKRALCWINVEKNLSKGRYYIIFYGYDLAGNENTYTKVLFVTENENIYYSSEQKNETNFVIGEGAKEEIDNQTTIIDKKSLFEKLPQNLRNEEKYLIFTFFTVPLFLILLFKIFFKKTLQISQIINKLEKDLDSLSIVEKYLQIKGDTVMEEKKYLLNVKSILETISDFSFFSQNYSYILKNFPPTIKQRLISLISKKIKDMEKRENLITLKKELQKILEFNDINEIQNRKKYLLDILKKCKSEIETELDILKELESLRGEK
ncbi:MAG: hypothetical protein QXX30_01395 [Candidatus Aenigmatarchaeota archaeon]